MCIRDSTRRLVELMGGQISAVSQLGKGTAFTFTCEYVESDDTLPTMEWIAPIRYRGTNVLIIDDNSSCRKFLSEIFEEWSFQPTLVSNGTEAVQLVKRSLEIDQPFGLVLLEEKLSGTLGGIETAKRIQTLRGGATIPLIMMVEVDSTELTKRFAQLQVLGSVVKPVMQRDLANQVLKSMKPSAQLPLVCENDMDDSDSRRLTMPQQKVLLAEDNFINQSLMVYLLEDAGHQVVVANNGKEAVEAVVNDQSFDLILMDVQMPEMDGYEATSAIRELESMTGRIPIIALTANAMAGDRDKCLNAGMDAYTTKPVQMETLEALMAELATPAS